MTKQFKGELKWINPQLLISEKNHDKIESFFLGLGVIFNDLKGLILFERMLIKLSVLTKRDVSVDLPFRNGISLTKSILREQLSANKKSLTKSSSADATSGVNPDLLSAAIIVFTWFLKVESALTKKSRSSE